MCEQYTRQGACRPAALPVPCSRHLFKLPRSPPLMGPGPTWPLSLGVACCANGYIHCVMQPACKMGARGASWCKGLHMMDRLTARPPTGPPAHPQGGEPPATPTAIYPARQQC